MVTWLFSMPRISARVAGMVMPPIVTTLGGRPLRYERESPIICGANPPPGASVPEGGAWVRASVGAAGAASCPGNGAGQPSCVGAWGVDGTAAGGGGAWTLAVSGKLVTLRHEPVPCAWAWA